MSFGVGWSPLKEVKSCSQNGGRDGAEEPVEQVCRRWRSTLMPDSDLSCLFTGFRDWIKLLKIKRELPMPSWTQHSALWQRSHSQSRKLRKLRSANLLSPHILGGP